LEDFTVPRPFPRKMFEGTCVFKYTAYVIILKGRSDIALILKTSISTLVVHEKILLFQAD